jgi:glucokinase
VCLESGGTKLVAALADSAGRLLYVDRRNRPPTQEALGTLATLAEMGQALAKGQGRVEAVALGFGGTVRRADQRPGPCFHEPGWESVGVVSYLEDAFDAPVFIENDCKLAALGEAHFGHRVESGVLLYVTIGTGIGAGVVLDGNLLRLGPLGEAEIGHVVVEEGGRACPCGNNGCLETVCSGPGLARTASETMGQALEPQILMERFHKRDTAAAGIVEAAATRLGRVLAGAINLLAPRVVILGGGVMTENQAFLDLIARKLEPLVFPFFRDHTRLSLSTLGENVVCQGAAVFAIQRLAQTMETP